MLFKQASKITFVMYQDQKAARAFQLDKQKLKLIALLISILFALSLLTSLFLAAQVKRSDPVVHDSQQVQRLEQQLLDQKVLQDELAQAQELNQQLLQKTPSAPVQREAILPLVHLPVGYQDLADKKWANVENINISFEPTQTLLHFNIINARQDGARLSGHILVLMGHGSQISLYPAGQTSLEQAMTTFNRGETFTISRFRKVESSFQNTPRVDSQVHFKIFIFSRAGDIIHQRAIGPVKVSRS